MNIHTLTVGPFEVNCYILRAPGAATCLVIDPGADEDLVMEALDKLRVRPAAYLLTHGHIDHLSALPELIRRYPAPVDMHPRDAAWAFSETNQLPPFYPPAFRAPIATRPLTEGLRREEAGLAYTVIETPGHSPGGVCLHFENTRHLFSGDTLFRQSVGRTDLPGGQPRVLAASLKKLADLPGETVVYPGHGPSTTLAEEKQNNFFFR